jgi:hypothetical protein
VFAVCALSNWTLGLDLGLDLGLVESWSLGLFVTAISAYVFLFFSEILTQNVKAFIVSDMSQFEH